MVHLKRDNMKQTLTILMIFIFLNSCSTKDTKTMVDKFTWNVQLAGYDFNKYDEKGETNLENFIVELDKFPWIEQLENYQKTQKGCSATLSVKDHKTGTDFWVSIAGDKNDNAYLIGYVYIKSVKGFMGLGKPKEKRWVEIYITKDIEKVKECFKLFFNREPENLVSTIKKLELFGEMEAKN